MGRGPSLEGCGEISSEHSRALCLTASALQSAQPAKGRSVQQTKGSFDVKTWDRCPGTGRWSAGRNLLLIGSGLECTLAEGQLLPLLSRNNIIYFYHSLWLKFPYSGFASPVSTIKSSKPGKFQSADPPSFMPSSLKSCTAYFFLALTSLQPQLSLAEGFGGTI